MNGVVTLSQMLIQMMLTFSWHVFEKKKKEGQNVFLLKVLSIKMDECCYNIKVKQTNSFHFLALYVYIK